MEQDLENMEYLNLHDFTDVFGSCQVFAKVVGIYKNGIGISIPSYSETAIILVPKDEINMDFKVGSSLFVMFSIFNNKIVLTELKGVV